MKKSKWIVALACWLDMGIFFTNLMRNGFIWNLIGIVSGTSYIVLFAVYVWLGIYPFDQ